MGKSRNKIRVRNFLKKGLGLHEIKKTVRKVNFEKKGKIMQFLT